MEAQALEFLKSLSESFGPSGFERDPVLLMKAYVARFAHEISGDKLGSLHFSARGKAGGPVVLLPGHVDEVGFIISGVNAHGFLTFNTIGGWFDQVLLGQRLKIRGAGRMVPGVIAPKRPHILPPEQRAKVVTREKMFIDIGCSNEREAKDPGVRIGDPVVPDSPFNTIEKNVYRKAEDGGEERAAGTPRLACGKAFDDRAGAFVAAEVVPRLKQQHIDHPNTVIGVATLQEEAGLPGARTSAHVVNPDFCITLQLDIAGDVPGIKAHEDGLLARDPDLRRLDDPQPGAEGAAHQHGGAAEDSFPALLDERRGHRRKRHPRCQRGLPHHRAHDPDPSHPLSRRNAQPGERGQCSAPHRRGG